jgi:hypothetical protein
VTASHTVLPDLDLLDADGLKALVLSQHEQLLSHRSEIEHLKLLIAKLRRMQFGRKSEKLDRQIEQLELKLEELESAKAARVSESASPSPVPPSSSLSAAAKPARQALPEHLPREVRTYTPQEAACAECGGRLRPLVEDVSEVLEYVPARFNVIRQVRPKLSCASCERIVRHPHRVVRSSAAWPDRVCWRMCWWPSTAITNRCIARPRCTLVKAWSWSGPLWRTGWVAPADCWNHWWKLCAAMS